MNRGIHQSDNGNRLHLKGRYQVERVCPMPFYWNRGTQTRLFLSLLGSMGMQELLCETVVPLSRSELKATKKKIPSEISARRHSVIRKTL